MARALRLRDLIRPLSMNDFLARHWLPEEPLLSDANPEVVERIRQIDSFGDGKALLKRLVGSVMLFGPNKLRATVPATEALTFLNHGFTIYVHSLEKSIPELTELGRVIKSELGVANWGVSYEAFVSQTNSISSVHYDHDINFQILLEGEKEWRIAPNSHIRNPLIAFHPTEHGREVFTEEAYARDPNVPVEMPANATRLTASPGSVLFLPRGYWHEVRSVKACLGVNIVIKGMTWASGIGRALQRRLHGDELARGYVCGVLATNRSLEKQTTSAFEAVRKNAIETLERMSIEEVFLGWADARFRWSPRASERVIREVNGQWSLEIPGTVSLDLDDALVATMKKLADLRQTFLWEHILHVARHDEVPPQGLWNLLMDLVDRELVENLPTRDERSQ